jgi:hypothetical protein
MRVYNLVRRLWQPSSFTAKSPLKSAKKRLYSLPKLLAAAVALKSA